MRVFISSTCYDLIDLRAELEAFFESAGVEPVMSDSLTSDFLVSQDANSIETCLANVRTCDSFIIILSNRYGPTLEKAGYAAVSATHLEYLEARKCKIPVHMYVRDRLEADFAIWKSNGAKPDLTLSWCKSDEDWRIFGLLEEHRRLKEAGGNNWLWTFRSSVELKERIRIDFKDTFVTETVHALFSNGSLPLLEVNAETESNDGRYIEFSLRLRNVGLGTAVSPELQIVNDVSRWNFKTLHPKESAIIHVRWAVQIETNLTLQSCLTYSTHQGHKFADDASIVIWSRVGRIADSSVSYDLTGRRYLGASDAALLMMPSIGGNQAQPL